MHCIMALFYTKNKMYESISFLFQCKMVVLVTIPLKFEVSHDGCMLKAISQDLEQLFEHWKIWHYKYISLTG
jgi:hypothetical protein